MAEWNEVLEGSLNQLIAKRFGMQAGSPSPLVAAEIFPVVVLEDDRVEYGFMKREVLGAARCVQGATAAVISNAMLRNPPNSGVIVTVLGFEMQTASNIDVLANYSDVANYATLDAGLPRDLRFGAPAPTNNTVAVPSHDATNAVPAGAKALFRFAANPTGFQRVELILGPGTSVEVRTVSVNTSLVVNWIWRERTAQPGELA